MVENPKYNVFETNWIKELLDAYQINHVEKPSAEIVAHYKERLPDILIRFWVEKGWCSWSQGQYWICDPSLLQPVIDYVFQGDSELDPARMIAFGYNAFGNVDIWYDDATIRLNLPNGMVRVEPREYDESEKREWTDDVMIGLKLSFNVSPHLAPWEDEKYNNMMPQALKAIGELESGEIYGFVPALSVGGRNNVKQLQRVKIREHLVLLASLDSPTLYDYAPPKEGDRTLGEVISLRKIGARQ